MRLFCDLLRQLGHDDDALLREVELDRAALLHPEARVSSSQAARVAERGLELAGDDGLGFRFASALKITLHGPVGLLATSSLTIGEALEAATRYVALRAPFLEFVWGRAGGEVVLEVRPTRDLGRHRTLIMESMTMGLVYMMEQLLEGASSESTVEMTGPEPPYYARLARFLPVPVRYGAEACVVRSPASVLDRRPWLADPAVAALAREQCEAELEKLFPEVPSLAAEIARRLAAHEEGVPALEVLAKKLHVSSRTLKRRLEQEGTTYRALVEAELRDRCVRLLRDTDLHVSEVAFRAGYTDVSNFSRAFRRWTGESPSAFRASRQARRPG